MVYPIKKMPNIVARTGAPEAFLPLKYRDLIPEEAEAMAGPFGSFE